MDLQHVVVGLREPFLGKARPRLRDAGDLVPFPVLDVEIPCVPVFTSHRAKSASAALELEANLADDAEVLLNDLTDQGSVCTRDGHCGLHELGGPGYKHEYTAALVDDLQSACPIIVWQCRHRLLEEVLADLLHRSDLLTVLVVDGVLGLDLEQLGLLIYHKDWLREHRSSAGGGAIGVTNHLHLLLDFCVRGLFRRIGQGIDFLAATRPDMLGPLTPIPVSDFVATEGVGVPVGWGMRGHDRRLAFNRLLPRRWC